MTIEAAAAFQQSYCTALFAFQRGDLSEGETLLDTLDRRRVVGGRVRVHRDLHDLLAGIRVETRLVRRRESPRTPGGDDRRAFG